MKKNGRKTNCKVVMATVLKRVNIVYLKNIFSQDIENSLHLAVLPVYCFFSVFFNL